MDLRSVQRHSPYRSLIVHRDRESMQAGALGGEGRTRDAVPRFACTSRNETPGSNLGLSIRRRANPTLSTFAHKGRRFDPCARQVVALERILACGATARIWSSRRPSQSLNRELPGFRVSDLWVMSRAIAGPQGRTSARHRALTCCHPSPDVSLPQRCTGPNQGVLVTNLVTRASQACLA